VGGDGAVHHGFLDISLLRGFPKMVLMAAFDEPTLRGALEFMREHEEGPSALRYPRDNVPTSVQGAETPAFELGKANPLAAGTDVAILAYGFPVNHALQAREALEQEGISASVFDARFAKPVDIDLVQLLIESGTPIITVEDHAVIGGFGACVLEACNDRHLSTDQIHRLGLPDRWIYQGSRGEQQAEAGIDADSIAAKAREIVAATKANKSSVHPAPLGGQTVPRRPSFGQRIMRAVGGKSDT
jgi:1-deoxy-D-xylulose-5-phosphate synthase